MNKKDHTPKKFDSIKMEDKRDEPPKKRYKNVLDLQSYSRKTQNVYKKKMALGEQYCKELAENSATLRRLSDSSSETSENQQFQDTDADMSDKKSSDDLDMSSEVESWEMKKSPRKTSENHQLEDTDTDATDNESTDNLDMSNEVESWEMETSSLKGFDVNMDVSTGKNSPDNKGSSDFESIPDTLTLQSESQSCKSTRVAKNETPHDYEDKEENELNPQDAVCSTANGKTLLELQKRSSLTLVENQKVYGFEDKEENERSLQDGICSPASSNEENQSGINIDTSSDTDSISYESPNFKLDDLLNTVMFVQSEITFGQIMNMVEAIYIRHNLSKSARSSILELIKLLAGPEFEKINMSSYFTSKLYTPIENVKSYSFFCPSCKIAVTEPIPKSNINKLDSVECVKCSKKIHISTSTNNYYLNLDLEYQLRKIFNDSDVLRAVIENARSAKNKSKLPVSYISDIHDAELYRSNKYIKSKTHEEITLTIILFTDGAAMFESTKNSLWPILAMLTELPMKLRFKFPLTLANLYTKKEPDINLMNAYMKTFVDQIKNLITNGFTISDKVTNEKFKIFIVPLCYTADSVARPIVQARIKFNGKYGCPWCYVEGEYAGGSMRYPTNQAENCLERDQDEYFKDVKKTDNMPRGEKTVKGVKGKSTVCSMLFMLCCFDSIWGFPLEWMHGVLIGSAKQQWKKWTDSSWKYKLSKEDINRIDERLMSIKALKEMYRTTNQLIQKSNWKASDWLYWVLYYSLPCLEEILRNEDYVNWAKFVNCIYKMLGRNISEETLKLCNKELNEYVKYCEKEYGVEFMTFNVHALTHLCQSVRKTGPLWATSAFPFESELGHLKNGVQGSHGVVEQISNRLIETFELKQKILDKTDISSEFCREVLSSTKVIKKFIRSDENAIIPFDSSSKKENKYTRCIFNKMVLHASIYDRPTKTDNTYVLLRSNEVVQIKYFFFNNNSCFAYVRVVENKLYKINHYEVEGMFLLNNARESCKNVSITDIKKKLLHVDVQNGREYVRVPCAAFDVQ